MGFLKKLLGLLVGLVAVIFGGIILCAVNPALTEKVSTLLYGDEDSSGILVVGEDGSTSLVLSNLFANGGNGEDPVVLVPDIVSQEGNEDQTSADTQSRDQTPVVTLEIPDQSAIPAIPSNVGSLTGYEPVQAVTQKVDDNVAKTLKEEIGTGETGSNLDFDATYYPFYQMLSEDQKSVYRQIYANAEKLTASFAPVKDIFADDLETVFEAVFGDHPELFYVKTEYTVKYTQAGKVVEIDLAYHTLANNLETAKSTFETAAASIVSAAQSLEDDYSKEKYVHDTLISQIVYDESATNHQSAYGALVDGACVCAGYARAMQYVMQKLGIPCYYCTGYSGEDHAWNIVKLYDGYYNADLTWDDTNPSTYDYFNKTDDDYAGTHVRTGLSVNLPPCNGTAYRNLESGAPSFETAEATVQNHSLPAESYDPTKDPYINQDPQRPLRYDEVYPEQTTTPTAEEQKAATLSELGLKESDVIWNLTDYYADCLKKMKAAGAGQISFQNIVPTSLYNTLETEYGKGNHKNGYITEALKSLGMNHCDIQLQAQRLGSGYYKIYHNIYSWNE